MFAATRDALALTVGLTSGFALALVLLRRVDATRLARSHVPDLLRLGVSKALDAVGTLVVDAFSKGADLGSRDARYGRVLAAGRLFYLGMATFCLGLVAMFVGVVAGSSIAQFLATGVLTLGYVATTGSLLFGEALYRRFSETAAPVDPVAD